MPTSSPARAMRRSAGATSPAARKAAAAGKRGKAAQGPKAPKAAQGLKAPKAAAAGRPAQAGKAARAGKAAQASAAAASEKPAKPAKLNKAAPPEKASKAVAAAAAEAVANDAAAPESNAKKPHKVRPKIVRDGFTMPESDFALIAELKLRALAAQRETKKSELLRAGLRTLATLDDRALLGALEQLEPLKVGRPKKGH